MIYASRYYLRSDPDTPDRVAERRRRTAILQQVRAELAERFPTITEANVDEALAYQEHRIRELCGGPNH